MDSPDGLETFPIGWHEASDGLLGWLKTLLGWLITIAGVSVGAPFWFDLLGKVANLRGVGGNALRPERAADPAPRPEPRAVEVRELVDKPWPPHRRTQRLAPASIGSRFDGGPGKL